MSKQWYYEVMGTVIGPLTAVELKQKVLKGQVQAETPVRMGADGRWQAADRVKGLMDAPAKSAAPAVAVAPRPASTPAAAAAPKPAPSSAVVKATAPAASPAPAAKPATPKAETHHGAGDTVARETMPLDDTPPQDYDFFRFVGFDTAIGAPLHDALEDHCRKHHLTLTEATKIALAQYLNRKDLLGPAQKEGSGIGDQGSGVGV